MEGYSFIRQNRPEIGLVSYYDLGEIYSSDERDALFNILLDPDALDQIYNLSRSGLVKEDIRTAGGLELPVYHSMAISSETSRGISNKIQSLIRTDGEIGDPGLQDFNISNYSDNIIVLHGGLAANNIEFRYLDEEGEVKKTVVPTSRESLFNSIVDSATGKFSEASFSSLIRIRRRSHLNNLNLRATNLLLNRETISESPTHIFKIPVYVRTPSNTNPKCELLECYCTVNSPLIIPVRIGTSGTISFSREIGSKDQNPQVSFVYGWELKLRSDLSIVKQEIITDSRTRDVQSISINVTGTPASNKECLLYVYLDPEQITEIDLSSLGIAEQAGKDIGLIGFNNLKKINISNNRLSTLPTWIKVLDTKLIELDISGNVWDEPGGIYSTFDYQDMRNSGISGISTAAPPSKTLTEFMCYSGYKASGGGNKNSSYKGYSTIQDSNNKLWKDSRKTSIERFNYLYNGNPSNLTQEPIPITISGEEGFRTFTLLNKLKLGSEIYVCNADFSRVFPNLFDISIDSSSGANPNLLTGLIPKINNTSVDQITIDYRGQTTMEGSIGYMGDTPFWTNTIQNISNGTITTKSAFETAAGVTTSLSQEEILNAPKGFIGKYNIKSFNLAGSSIVGGILTGTDDVSGTKTLGVTHLVNSNDPTVIANAWSSWLSQTSYISFDSFGNDYRDIYFRIAKGSSYKWMKLSEVNLNYIYGVDSKYISYNEGVTTENSSDILTGLALQNLQAYAAAWGGKIFSIKDVESTLKTLQIGRNRWKGYTADLSDPVSKFESSNGNYKYLLPKNFISPSKENTKFESLSIGECQNYSSEDQRFILRSSELSSFKVLNYITFHNSKIFGVFPALSANVNSAKIKINISYNNFRDLSNLGTDRNQKVIELFASEQSSSFGGCRLPNFSTSSTNITKIDLNNNLSTKDINGKVLLSCLADPDVIATKSHLGTLQQEVSIPPVTWNAESADGKIHRIVIASGSTDISKQVYVNDEIRDTNESGNVIGIVTQVHKSGTTGFIHVTGVRSDVNIDFSGKTLAFIRRGQIVSNYFQDMSNLQELNLQNNRLVGKVPTFKGAKNLKVVNLTNNLFTEWPGDVFTTKGFFSGGSVKLTSFDIRENPLSVEAIRLIIKELYDSKTANSKLSYSALKVNVQKTKWNGTGYNTDWSRSEVFYNTTSKQVDDPTWIRPTKTVDSGQVDANGNPIYTQVPDTSATPPKITVVSGDPLLDQYKILIGKYGISFSGIAST